MSQDLPDLVDVWTEENHFQELETDVHIQWENGATADVSIMENLEYVVSARWAAGASAGTDFPEDEVSAYSGGLRVINAYLAQKQGGDRLEEEFPTVYSVLTE